MKANERKLRQNVPLTGLPAFLRRLADAIERKSDHLPMQWTDLPEQFSKVAVKGKRREDRWEMKVKLKTDAAPALPSEPANREVPAKTSVNAHNPSRDYKALKKRMKAAFKTIGEAIANQQLPEADIIRAFLADSQRMTAFSGESYGEDCYPAFLEACRQLARAYEAGDWSALTTGYASLDHVKKDCHKAFK